jgi:hypothetical protein
VSLRARIVSLVAVCVLAVAGTVVYLVSSRAHSDAVRRATPPVARTTLAALARAPRIVFRSTSVASQYGMVAAVALNDPSGPRAFLGASCDRVYATAQRVLCLSSDRGLVTTYAAKVLDGTGSNTVQSLALAGIPSRARLSRDGTLAATTSFTAGDSYAGTSFSTRTVITQLGGVQYGSLEDFTLIHQGKVIKPTDRNYWGVTFAADDKTFYATVEWAHHTWLVRGDLTTRRVVTLHQDAECPSLSPDGKHVVYKQRGSLPQGQWRLVAYDVASGTVTPLGETHSVDDQVEWLDNSRIIYGLPRSGTNAAVSDVWSLPADGSGKPTLLIPEAWSPAVIS